MNPVHELVPRRGSMDHGPWVHVLTSPSGCKQSFPLIAHRAEREGDV